MTLNKLVEQSEMKLLDSKNVKIRMLEPQVGKNDQNREYLVEDSHGNLKVLSSVEMIVTHPLEFIDYLQKNINRSF
jgi:hypothetical protein